MLEYKEEKLRFEIISDYIENPVQPRIFAVIEITSKQLKEETYWKQLFQEYVGNHNNLSQNDETNMQPQSMQHLFYDNYNKRAPVNYKKIFSNIGT